MIRVGLLGASGRMGKWVADLLKTEFSNKAELVASPSRNEPLDSLLRTDVVIDFASPAGMLALTELALTTSQPLPAFVVGSTGWTTDENRRLNSLALRTPVLISSNFSTGVLAVIDTLKKAAPLFVKLGYTPVLVETHHRHKKDAPSGTAIMLQRAIAPENPAGVQTHAVRAGEIIGDHEVTFYGHSDHVTLGHFAQDRSIFARGSIDVALWLAGIRGKTELKGFIAIDQYFEELRK